MSQRRIFYNFAASLALASASIGFVLIAGCGKRPPIRQQQAKKQNAPTKKTQPKKTVKPKRFEVVKTPDGSVYVKDLSKSQLPKVPLGSVTVHATRQEIQEGDNLDLSVTIHNQVAGSTLYLCVPETYSSYSFGYRVQKVAPEREKPFDTLPAVKTILRLHGGQPFHPRFQLKGNARRAFPMVLFVIHAGTGLAWLSPGKYEIRVMYLSLEEGRHGLEALGDKQIDYHKPLISDSFLVTVNEPPSEQKQAVKLAKEFLRTDLVELRSFMRSYQTVLARKLSPSLEKRVRYFVAKQNSARGNEKLALTELHKLADMMLTPGEAELVHGRLATYYRDNDQPQEAVRWAQGHTTPWAEKLRKELGPIVNK